MTDLLGGAGQSELLIEPNDIRALGNHFTLYMNEFRYQGAVGDQRTPWWPRGGLMPGDAGDVGPIEGAWHNLPDISKGSRHIYGFTGVTRDAYGGALGCVTVKLFLTAANGNNPADTAIYSTVSDPYGNYTVFTSFYPDGHYMVMYKAGSPNVFGTTDNILIGA